MTLSSYSCLCNEHYYIVHHYSVCTPIGKRGVYNMLVEYILSSLCLINLFKRDFDSPINVLFEWDHNCQLYAIKILVCKHSYHTKTVIRLTTSETHSPEKKCSILIKIKLEYVPKSSIED